MKKMRRSWILMMTLILSLSMVLAACGGGSPSTSSTSPSENGNGSEASSQDPIKIGVIGAFQLQAGKEIEDAAKLAIQHINENGGILGRPVEAVYGDTKANPEEGKKVVERMLYQDKVEFIVGEHRSEVALAVQPVIMDAKKIFMNTGSASPKVTEGVLNDYEYYKYTFRPMLDSNQLGEGFLQQFNDLVTENNFSKVALIAESAVWVDPIVEQFQEIYGDKVVYVDRPPTDTKDFSVILSKLNESGAEAAMLLFSADQGITFVRQWAERQIPVVLSGYVVQAQSPDFWAQTEGKTEGLMTWKMGVRSEVTEKTIPFWDGFEEMFGRAPGPYPGITTYDALIVLADAINQAGTTEVDKVVEALEQGTFIGASGVIQFRDDHGYNTGQGFVPFTYIQWQDGEMVPVWPKDVATGSMINPPWMNEQ